MFYLSEAFKSIFAKKFISLVTIVTTTIAVSLCSLSVFLLLSSEQINSALKSRVRINVFLEDDIPGEARKNLENALSRDASIKEHAYISKERARRNFEQRTGENFGSILDLNPLPASYIIKPNIRKFSGSDLDRLVRKYSVYEGVEEVSYDYAYNLDLIRYSKTITNIIFTLSALLMLLSVYFIYSANVMIIENKKELFRNMKFMGASPRAVKIPVFYQGIIFGILAAVLSIIFIFSSAIIMKEFLPISVRENNLYVIASIIILALGILLGLLSSIFSIRKVDKIIKDI